MTTPTDAPFTLAFVGHSPAAQADRATAYEDAVLPLLADHGARVLYRGRRAPGEDDALPLEVHLIGFPSRAAYAAYLGDPRRAALLREYGDVFTRKEAVVLETLVG